MLKKLLIIKYFISLFKKKRKECLGSGKVDAGKPIGNCCSGQEKDVVTHASLFNEIEKPGEWEKW